MLKIIAAHLAEKKLKARKKRLEMILMIKSTGLISNIQKYSTKDGPGLRSTVFLTGCNLRCKWCANPESMYPGKKIMYYKERCQKCGLCISVANNNSITYGETGCIINRQTCTNLVDMPDVCPYDAYEKMGMEINSEELSNKLIRDQDFYRTSGGGVTFSGGEPCLQGKFVYETAKLLKKENIHIALDTAGFIQRDKMMKILEVSDLVLFDIKAYNSDLHKEITGVGNGLILENAKLMSDMKKDMYIRMVIIPGMNDDLEDIRLRLEFIKSLGNSVKQVDILKYHKLGEGKYLKLGLEYPIPETHECSEELMDKIKKTAESLDLKYTVGA